MRTKGNRKRVTRQRGAAMMGLALMVLLGVITAIVAFASADRAKIESDKKTMQALAQAKAALISYAATSPHPADVNTTRPGDFPCPDRNNDGLDNDGPCNPGELGRIPWQTLGISVPQDVNGETIWYAISGNFRNVVSNPGSLINSDTVGTLTVYADNGATVLTNQAVAVLFAPGPVIGTQARDAPNVNIAANYLDAKNGRNNAVVNGPYIAGQRSSTFNDQVVYITTSELMPIMELQVIATLTTSLTSYRNLSTCLCYPWAVTFSSGLNASNVGVNRGRLPATALPESWGTNGSTAVPAWFANNSWDSVIYYAIAKQNTNHAGAGCTTCTAAATLTINGTPGFSVAFFTPGTAASGVVRPSLIVGDYLRDPQNSDDSDDTYITPTATTFNRNRLSTLTSAASPP